MGKFVQYCNSHNDGEWITGMFKEATGNKNYFSFQDHQADISQIRNDETRTAKVELALMLGPAAKTPGGCASVKRHSQPNKILFRKI